MKHLNDSTTASPVKKIFKSWDDLLEQFDTGRTGESDDSEDMDIVNLSQALAERWEGHHIVILIDEVRSQFVLNQLKNPESVPESVTHILAMNPLASTRAREFPNIHHVTRTTQYRSTIAITSFARYITSCIGQCKWQSVLEGNFGSDVEGTNQLCLTSVMM